MRDQNHLLDDREADFSEERGDNFGERLADTSDSIGDRAKDTSDDIGDRMDDRNPLEKAGDAIKDTVKGDKDR
jgi:hypothetical protein